MRFSFNPEEYVCYKTDKPLVIDGDLSEDSWQNAPWTADFVDIEGSLKPLPVHTTRAKMLWDDQYFYVAAEIIEPDIWATYDKRDMVIFHENDFEVFIDPTGDTHHYYELEINALGTEWDLMLTKPYRDGGKAIDSWEILGLKSGIKIKGTLNNPSDKDDRWWVELAFPWQVLEEAANGRPKPGDQWRVNFSRVNWQIENKNGNYAKKKDPETGKHFPEYNWVWSPQGVIAMHQPETWGFVQFSEIVAGKGEENFIRDHKEEMKWLLRNLYYAQSSYFKKHKQYADNVSLLDLKDKKIADQLVGLNVTILKGMDTYQASFIKNEFYYQIDQEGRTSIKTIDQ